MLPEIIVALAILVPFAIIVMVYLLRRTGKLKSERSECSGCPFASDCPGHKACRRDEN